MDSSFSWFYFVLRKSNVQLYKKGPDCSTGQWSIGFFVCSISSSGYMSFILFVTQSFNFNRGAKEKDCLLFNLPTIFHAQLLHSKVVTGVYLAAICQPLSSYRKRNFNYILTNAQLCQGAVSDSATQLHSATHKTCYVLLKKKKINKNYSALVALLTPFHCPSSP